MFLFSEDVEDMCRLTAAMPRLVTALAGVLECFDAQGWYKVVADTSSSDAGDAHQRVRAAHLALAEALTVEAYHDWCDNNGTLAPTETAKGVTQACPSCYEPLSHIGTCDGKFAWAHSPQGVCRAGFHDVLVIEDGGQKRIITDFDKILPHGLGGSQK